MHHARRDYLRFAKRHGGDDAKVEIRNGYFLFPDGAFVTMAGSWDQCCYGIPEPNQYQSRFRNERIERERLGNIATYWDTRLAIAADEFRALKREVADDLQTHQVAGDPADLQRLKELAKEVAKCQTELKRATRNAAKADPAYRTPEQQREDEEMENLIAEDAEQFERLLKAITI